MSACVISSMFSACVLSRTPTILVLLAAVKGIIGEITGLSQQEEEEGREGYFYQQTGYCMRDRYITHYSSFHIVGTTTHTHTFAIGIYYYYHLFFMTGRPTWEIIVCVLESSSQRQDWSGAITLHV